MRRTSTIVAIAGLIAASTLLGACTQESATVPLSLKMYIQLSPGQLPAFEEARARSIEHRTNNNYPWTEYVAITENNVVRIWVNLDNGWEDVAARRAWFQDNPVGAAGASPLGGGDLLGTEISEALPEYSYVPDNPRVPAGEVEFIREARVFPSPGNGAGVQETMGAIRDALQEAGSDQTRYVTRNLIGRGAFSFSVHYMASDAADYYASRQAMQPIFDRIQARGNGNARRIRNINWISRDDLHYTPAD